MGVITKVIDAIDDDDIRNFINHDIDRDYTYCDDWEVEMHHVNLYLNKLFVEKVKDSRCSISKRDSSDARRALQPVNRERYINAWIEDLKQHYFPVLEKVWIN